MKTIRNIILILLAVTLASCTGTGIAGTGIGASTSTGPLTASGTVETTQVPVAPESSGRITKINVQEGDTVKAGEVLFTIDSVLLQAQRSASAASLDSANAAVVTADAAVASAQVQYDIAYNAAMVKIRSSRTADWTKNQPGEFTLPLWYYNQTEQYSAAQSSVEAAQTAWSAMLTQQASVQTRAASADFMQAESNLAAAQANYLIANNLYNKVKNSKNIDDMTRRQLFLLARDTYLQSKNVAPKWTSTIMAKDIRDEAQHIYDDAKTALKDAQTAYDDAITTDGAKDILKARAKTSVAEEHYYLAMDFQRTLETGAQSESVNAAQKALDQSKASAAQTQNSVKLAQANLDLIDAQIAKTTVTAPVDGVVLTRSGEPGSVVNAGGTVLTLGRLDKLTITVYVPEDRIGEVVLGESANVSVDTFPGETFSSTVNYISDQAEFTPRNVQTVEGRVNTVFAVKLKLSDTSGKLKPGMPADVVFVGK